MRAWARRGRAVVTAVLMVSPWARGALAQIPHGSGAPDGSPPPESMRTVSVTIVAGGDDADPLVATIRELLGRLGLNVDPHLVAGPSPVLEPAPAPAGLSVSIDLASRYEAVVIVRSARTELRRTVPRDSTPAIVREEIGEAVRLGVEAQLLVDASRSAPPPPAPVPAPSPVIAEAPPPTAAPSRWFALDLTILAGGGLVATDAGFVPRVGGGAVIGSRHRLRPSLTVTAAYVVPFGAAPFSAVTTQASMVSLRAVPAIEILHASWVAVNVGAGGGVDVISVDTSLQHDPAASVQLSAVPNRVDPIVTALATADAALAPGVAFTLVVGADVDFAAPQYFVNPGGGDILTTWRVRPVALAGFTFTAVGNSLFAARTP
jgi:hypothetical protein